MSVDGKPNQQPKGEISPEERAALERRSGELGRKLEQARQQGMEARRDTSSSAGSARGAALGKAFRLSAELLSGIIVGSALGWYLDKWLGNSKPWLFVLFFLLGAAAGMMNLIRTAMRETNSAPPSVKDERDEDN
ncbi:MAG: AtpZ/AtpI family protein [Hyphomicrobiaceae bacterium]